VRRETGLVHCTTGAPARIRNGASRGGIHSLYQSASYPFSGQGVDKNAGWFKDSKPCYPALLFLYKVFVPFYAALAACFGTVKFTSIT